MPHDDNCMSDDNTPLTQMTNYTAGIVTFCASVAARPLTVLTALDNSC